MKPRDYVKDLERAREARELERETVSEEEEAHEEPGQEEDEVRQWRTYSVTRQLAATLRKDKEHLERLLFQAAMVSSDPVVRQAAAYVKVVRGHLEFIDGTS